ncbi:MAG TPA: hypothetical protein DHV08_06070 [Rhodocyclaceae bacterium]|nr:MAG: hypothetical protein AUK49_05745 [Betaproteobacteria bacterium CG2_30_68_42]PIV75230.1 MAG: hypothetical protein COW56_03590 [Rhodocyclales bacterium CG17_big_fil_post_rev_8_21_14_2_50_68_7]PIX74370.1 MAG: hypothetical protein COZ38_10680 [Rhodocyclales bacterium CG_4_10_14_3_um_filter_68_10]PJA56491.1 MAG: hypothetical protein CO164_12805 [Rhodocyclales bacterium CG_4_9_14_3_um_filter_68_10]HCX33151.1 hypothetical protein [Rhodocyclaceae bacterium]
MARTSVIFCLATLAASALAAALAFPYAALPRGTLETCEIPVPAEKLPDVDLGGGFGKVPVIELVAYYIENPPAPAAPGAAPAAVKRFGGC